MRTKTSRPGRPLHGGSAAAILAGAALGLPSADAQPPAGQRLEEVVVTSSLIATPRRQIGTAVSVIPAEAIELRGYHSVADVLRTQAGVGVSNSGGPGKSTALRIRGEESFRTLLIIDGVKAVDPSAPQVAPSFDSLLTTSDLERVEILRGPQGFVYGADAGGVINIITRTGRGGIGGRASAEYGTFGTVKYDASVAGGSERGDYFLSVSDLETDGFNAQTADATLRDDDGAENTTLHAKLGWNATEDLRLQLVARDVDASSMYDGCFSTLTFATVHDCVATIEQTTYKVSATHDGDVFGNAFGYSGVDVARDNLSDSASSFATQGELSRFEYTGTFSPSDTPTLVYGLELQNERVASDETLERDQNAYYIEYLGSFGERLFVSAGARHDDNDDFGTYTSSRLSAAYLQDLDGGHSLKYRMSYGTGFRPPSLFEISYNRGPFAYAPASDVVLEQESSRGYDVGIEYDSAGGLHAEATYFDHEIEDEIFFDLAGFSGYLQSQGTSTSTGVELAASAPLGERWELSGNWTHNVAENTENEQRRRRPRNMGNIGVSYAAANDKLRFIANLRWSSDAVDIGGAPLDDYEVLDLSMAYSFNETMELYGRMQNATDEDYQEVIGYRSAGRAAYAGVRLSF